MSKKSLPSGRLQASASEGWGKILKGLVLLGILLAAGAGAYQFGLASQDERTTAEIEHPDLSALAEKDREAIESQKRRLEQASPEAPSLLAQESGALGKYYLAFDFRGAAETAFSNAAGLDPEEWQWSYLLGVTLAGSGDTEAALAQFSKVREENPDNIPNITRICESLHVLERDDEAATCAQSLLQADESNVMAHYILGLQASEAGDHESVIEHLTQVSQIQPQASSIFTPLSLAYEALGEELKAKQARVRRGSGRILVADPLVSEVMALRTTATSLLSQGSQFAEQGRMEEAEQSFRRAVELEPDNSIALYSLGAALADLSQFEEAEETLKKSLSLGDADQRVKLALALVLGQQLKDEEARQYLEEVLEVDPGNLVAGQWMGLILRRGGDCEAALPYLAEVLETESVDTNARLNQMYCFASAQQFAEAKEAGLAHLELDAGDRAVAAALVRIVAASPDPEVRDATLAEDTARALLDDREDADANEVLAMALAEQGRFDEAVLYQSQALELASNRDEGTLMWMRSLLDAYEAGTPNREPWPGIGGE